MSGKDSTAVQPRVLLDDNLADGPVGWPYRIARACGPWCIPVVVGCASGLVLLRDDSGLRSALAGLGMLAFIVFQVWAVGHLRSSARLPGDGADLLSVLSRAMPIPMCIADFATGTLVQVSDRMCELLKYRREDLEGGPIAPALIPTWREGTYRQALETLARTGQLQLREVPIAASDGTILWFDLQGQLVTRQGRDLAIVTFIDITDRRLMEQSLLQRSEELRQTNRELNANLSRLAASEARHRALFDQSMDAILVVDAASGVVRDANAKALQLTGAERDDLLGRPVAQFEAPGAPPFATIAQQAASREGVFYSELRLRRTDGALIFVDLSASPVSHGDEQMLVLALREVSERRRMREALERTNHELKRQSAELERVNAQLSQVSQAKSQYLANISHEIRTPLNAINGFAELLADESYGELTPQQRSFVRDITEAGAHLLQLINDVIDLAKVESGKIQLELQPAAMNRLVEQAVRVIRGAARERSASIRVFPDPTEPVALVDERRTKQVLLNLLTNAIRYAPEGSTVDLTIQTTDDDQVKVSVRDDGIGIDPANHERIFEEFVRLGPLTDHPGGAGLGLPLSRKLVQLQGGQIGVESSLGTGATFWFTVPIAHPPEEDQAEGAKHTAEVKVGEYLKPN